MIIAFFASIWRTLMTIREAVQDGAELHREMSHRHPGLMGSE